MKNTNIPRIVSLATIILLATACRTHKQLTSSSTSSTTVCSASIDSTAQRLMSTHRKTTSITFLPMQTPALPSIPTPDAQAPERPAAPDITPAVQDLITQLLEQGGGTIIIQEDEQLQQDQSNTINHVSVQDTTTTQNTNQEQNTTNPPRASPVIDKIFYIFLLLAFIIVLLQGRRNQ